MVQLGIAIDGSSASIGGGASALPEGWYNGVITQTTHKGVKDTKNSYLEAVVSIQPSGKYIHRFNLWNDNPDAQRIANQELAAFCAVLGIQGSIQDSRQMENIPFGLYLSVEENDYKGRKTIQNRCTNLRYGNGQEWTPPGKSGSNAAPQGGGGAPAGFTPPGAAPGAAPGAPPAGVPGAPPGFTPPGAPPAGAPAPGAPQQPWGGAPQGAPPGQPYPGQPAPGAPAPGYAPQPPAPPQGQPAYQPAPGAPGAPPAPGQFQPGAPGAFPGGGAPGFTPPGAGPWGGPQQ